MIEFLQPIILFFEGLLPAGPVKTLLLGILQATQVGMPYYADYMLFLLFFVPLYYLVPRQGRVLYLLAASIALVGYMYGFGFVVAFLGVPLFVHGLVLVLHKRALADVAFRKKATWALVGFILLVYFTLLFIEGLARGAHSSVMTGHFINPLLHFCGIAYMVPKLVQYVVDALRGKFAPTRVTRLALYLVFFPTLRMGPIARFEAFNEDVENLGRTDPTWSDIRSGLGRIVLGLLKAVGNMALFFYLAADLSTLEAINQQSWLILYWNLVMNVFSVYLYFSGYSDVAIGFSRLLGFHMPENFYLPFFSENLGVWWRRWHMSLSFWLRDYVYRPLGGSKHKAVRNVFITFLACGAWHALALNYLIWGFGQAVGLIGWVLWHRYWVRLDADESGPAVLKSLAAFGKKHPTIILNLSRYVTFNYFCLVGIYFIFEFERANLYFLRFVTFGLASGH